MPWAIKKNHPDCPASKPWAVINAVTGRKVGCHPTKASARDQQQALYVNVPDSTASQEIDATTFKKIIQDEMHPD